MIGGGRKFCSRSAGNVRETAQLIASLFAEYQFLSLKERKHSTRQSVKRIEVENKHFTAVTLSLPATDAKIRTRTGAAANFGEVREVRVMLPEPYLRTPPKSLNVLGIPDKPYYRTTDACTILGIKPELFRYRLYTGKYPEFARDGKGRLFSLEDLQMLMRLSQQQPKARQSKV